MSNLDYWFGLIFFTLVVQSVCHSLQTIGDMRREEKLDDILKKLEDADGK